MSLCWWWVVGTWNWKSICGDWRKAKGLDGGPWNHDAPFSNRSETYRKQKASNPYGASYGSHPAQDQTGTSSRLHPPVNISEVAMGWRIFLCFRIYVTQGIFLWLISRARKKPDHPLLILHDFGFSSHFYAFLIINHPTGETSEQPKHFHFQHVKLNLPIATYKYNILHFLLKLFWAINQKNPNLAFRKNKSKHLGSPRYTKMLLPPTSFPPCSAPVATPPALPVPPQCCHRWPRFSAVTGRQATCFWAVAEHRRPSNVDPGTRRGHPAGRAWEMWPRRLLVDPTGDLWISFLKNRPGRIKPTSRFVYMRDWFVQLGKYT